MVRAKQITIDTDLEINGHQLKNAVVELIPLAVNANVEEGRFSYAQDTHTLYIGDGTVPQVVGAIPVLENINQIGFNTNYTASYQEGLVFYDKNSKALSYYTEISDIPAQRINREQITRVYNDSGATIPKGRVVYTDGVNVVEGASTIQLACGCDRYSSERVIGITAHDIGDEEIGILLRFSYLLGQDTSSFTNQSLLYLSTDEINKGTLTDIRPSSPNYAVKIGSASFIHPNFGVIGIESTNFNGSDTEVNIDGLLNGIVTETPQVNVTSDGTTITATVTNEAHPTKDLPFMLGGNRYLLDTYATPKTVELSPGISATQNQKNFIYIYLNSGVPTLAASVTEPAIPFCKIGEVIVFDAARTQTDGKPFGYRRHNNAIDLHNGVNDGALGIIKETLTAIREKLGSNWNNGQDITPDVNNTTIRALLTAGTARQFRKVNTPSFDGTKYLIYNDNTNTVNYQDSINLTDIVADANGNTLLSNNTFYTIRLFYMLNSNGIGNHIIATRPLGSYSGSDAAISDAEGYTVNVTDTDIEEIVYPLYDLIISRTGGGGATITLIQTTDLRSKLPARLGGGAAQGAGTDDKTRISTNDTDNSYLDDKITTSGATKTIINPSGNEQLNISVDVDMELPMWFGTLGLGSQYLSQNPDNIGGWTKNMINKTYNLEISDAVIHITGLDTKGTGNNPNGVSISIHKGTYNPSTGLTTYATIMTATKELVTGAGLRITDLVPNINATLNTFTQYNTVEFYADIRTGDKESSPYATGFVELKRKA